MPRKVSCNEVFEMAFQIEQLGYDFYKTMAHNATNIQLMDGYNQLAQEEKEHIHSFRQLRTSIEKIDIARIDNWDEVSLFFKTYRNMDSANLIFQLLYQGILFW